MSCVLTPPSPEPLKRPNRQSAARKVTFRRRQSHHRPPPSWLIVTLLFLACIGSISVRLTPSDNRRPETENRVGDFFGNTSFLSRLKFQQVLHRTGDNESYFQESASGRPFQYVRGSDYGGGIGGIWYTLRNGMPSFTHYNNQAAREAGLTKAEGEFYTTRTKME